MVPLDSDTLFITTAMVITRYSAERQPLWDSFIEHSKNGTFLFSRDYMEYHADRFSDFSLIIQDDTDGHVAAVFPAHRDGDTICSHNGLTYGGLITSGEMTLPRFLAVFELLLGFLRREHIGRLLYRTAPYIYHKHPADEDRYALFLCGAQRIRASALAVVNQRSRLRYQNRRLRGVKKAKTAGLAIIASADFCSFWDLLTSVLAAVHGSGPVHSIDEIQRLHERFPNNIKLFLCFDSNELVAGVVMYETTTVARAQYIASNDRGRTTGALDLLFDYLLNDHYADKLYFDFGSSDLNGGRTLNRGLCDQKEGFGARTVMLDHYCLDLEACQQGALLSAIA